VPLDLRTLGTDELDTDVCVVGAGAAGLALAHELRHSGLDVLLVERGGERHEPGGAGENVGPGDIDLVDGRAYGVGGTTRLWAGQCTPLDPEDLEARAWAPLSGWPLSGADLEPYYRRAEALLDIGGAVYDERTWRAFGLEPPDLDPARLRARFTVWLREADLAKLTARALGAAPRVRVLLYAPVVGLAAEGGAVTSLELAAPGGRRVRVRARRVVLAAGTIENARLLLASGLGGEHDVCGRFLQEHPNAHAATVADADHRYLQDRFALLYRRGRRHLARLTLAPETQRRAEVLDCAAVFVFEHDAGSGVEAAKELLRAARARHVPEHAAARAAAIVRNTPDLARLAYRRFRLGRSPDTRPRRVRLQIFAEQAPSRESRVTLSERRDALGLPLARVDWRLAEVDGRTVRAMVDAAGEELRRLGLGRVEPEPWVLDQRPERAGVLRDSFHTIGTTRMAAEAREGVVDADCRVHGLANLYVAGPSVFPTSGWANPTFAAVALALRLADRLRAG
jgi:choline dehydrogenase-like flavoprotein